MDVHVQPAEDKHGRVAASGVRTDGITLETPRPECDGGRRGRLDPDDGRDARTEADRPGHRVGFSA